MSKLHNAYTARQVSDLLLNINAVQLRPDQPYTWSSGWKSPIYCDNRKIQSYPNVRSYISSSLAVAIEENFPATEIIASVATGAITHGVLTAEKTRLPHVYINKKAKEHGMKKLIDGDFEQGQKTVVIEDLFSTGKSSLTAVQAAKAEGLDVIGVVGIMTYGFAEVEEVFANEKSMIVTLTDYATVIEAAKERGIIRDDQLEILAEWRRNPSTWTGLKNS